MTIKRLGLLAFVVIALHSVSARADVAPPNSCMGEGSACMTAGAMYDQAGVCTKSTCHRAMPDGGSMAYDCLLCMQADAGAGGDAGGSGGGAGGSSDGGGGAGGAGGSSDGGAGAGGGGGKSDDGGCSLGAIAPEGAVAGAMLLIGLIALAVSRRR